MDVTPPLAAGQSSRRTEPLSAPTQPSRAAMVLRRLGIAVASLAVAGLTAAACVLSFDALRALAEKGGARADLSYLYPAGFDALLVIALISVLLMRSGRLLLRLQAWLILALLIAGAAAANVVIATGTPVDIRQASIVVAVIPWVMLVFGLWLLMLPSRHARIQPSAADRAESSAHTEIIPFGGEERDPEPAPPLNTGPAVVAPAAEPGGSAVEVPLGEPADVLAEGTDAAPEPADEPPVQADARPEPADVMPVQADARPEPADVMPVQADVRPEPADAVAETGPAVAEHEHEHAVPEPEADQGLVPKPRTRSTPEPPPQRDPDRPIRWGDLIRPAGGDVLVHPLPSLARRPDPGDTQPYPQMTDRVTEHETGDDAMPADDHAEPGEGPDTQPYPHLREDAAPLRSGTAEETDPDPAHDAAASDGEETSPSRSRYTEEAVAPPSGRMRSTPLPPEE